MTIKISGMMREVKISNADRINELKMKRMALLESYDFVRTPKCIEEEKRILEEIERLSKEGK